MIFQNFFWLPESPIAKDIPESYCIPRISARPRSALRPAAARKELSSPRSWDLVDNVVDEQIKSFTGTNSSKLLSGNKCMVNKTDK